MIENDDNAANNEDNVEMTSDHEHNEDSPTKTTRPRNRTTPKAQSQKVELPVREDPECLKFVENTDDNILVDKMVLREIYQIDQLQNNPYVNWDNKLAEPAKMAIDEL